MQLQRSQAEVGGNQSRIEIDQNCGADFRREESPGSGARDQSPRHLPKRGKAISKKQAGPVSRKSSRSQLELRNSRAPHGSSQVAGDTSSAGRKSHVSYRTNNILECKANKRVFDILCGNRPGASPISKKKRGHDSKATSFVSGAPNFADDRSAVSRFDQS